jgi:hypothetical protein
MPGKMVSLEFRKNEAGEKAKAPPWGTGLSWGWEDLGKALTHGSARIGKGSRHAAAAGQETRAGFGSVLFIFVAALTHDR